MLLFATFIFLLLITPASVEDRQSQPERQQPTVRFGVEVDYVEVDAWVTDADGNFVSDLGSDDFEIYEDGERQEISGFTVVDIPIERPKPVPFAEPVESDVRTNTQVSEGRVYVIVLDDNHTDARRTEYVKRVARGLIERRMGTNDIAAVIHTSGRRADSQEFTSSKSLLLAAIDRFSGRKLRSATLEILDMAQGRQPGPRGRKAKPYDPWEEERVLRARSTLETLEELSEGLAEMRGRRKAIVYFGEGLGYGMNQVFGVTRQTPTERAKKLDNATSIIDSTERTIGEATRANVAIYTIDPRGLGGTSEVSAAIGNIPPDFDDMIENADIPNALQEELRSSQESLQVLSGQTGGFAVLNQNDLAPGLTRIVEENSRYYLLGYYPSNTARDGKFRKIGVKVKAPDVNVRARQGYVAPGKRDEKEVAEDDVPEGYSPEMNRLIQSPLPVPGITMRATAFWSRVSHDRAVVPVVVEMNIDGFQFDEREGKLHDTVELSAVALDIGGKVEAGVRRNFRLSVIPRIYRLMTQSGFRIMTALELPSGRYQLRILALESGAGKAGSLFYDVEIPEYNDSGVLMTPLVVTSTAESRIPILGVEEDKQKAPLLPTTRRAFSRQDRLSVVAEIYPRSQSGSSSPHVEITTTLKATDDQAVFTSTQERDGEDLTGEAEAIVHKVEIPLADLRPGNYLLDMKARGTSDQSEVVRQVLIEIF